MQDGDLHVQLRCGGIDVQALHTCRVCARAVVARRGCRIHDAVNCDRIVAANRLSGTARSALDTQLKGTY